MAAGDRAGPPPSPMSDHDSGCDPPAAAFPIRPGPPIIIVIEFDRGLGAACFVLCNFAHDT